ncbi:hypothetical protein D3C81_1772450 [compost metagenome]
MCFATTLAATAFSARVAALASAAICFASWAWMIGMIRASFFRIAADNLSKLTDSKYPEISPRGFVIRSLVWESNFMFFMPRITDTN